MATLLFFAHEARSDDGIFPAAPAARSAIDFDGRGFTVNGKRTFIASGTLHYSRVPRGLWRDRLLKFKRAGINTVETYTFWNVHEPQPGQFNFSGDADLSAFLSLSKSLGMLVIVRVGPYYCAEWDSGGYPIWMRNVPDLKVREDNAPFKKAVGEFFDRVLPIVARHQIHKGGNVVMVQLENEHPRGWGRDMPDGYFRYLRDKYLAAGLEVPYFFSGLHHSNDPAGDHSWDSKGRDNPWFSTEFWPGWFDIYGPLSPENFRKFDRGTWKIIAYGGNGYNYYMLHGGSNFDYFNNHEDAASYDYGAAVGQAGDLRPIYYRFKRAAQFATSFDEILENSENADAKYQASVKNVTEGKIRITARTSPAGDIAFLSNDNDLQTKVQFVAADGTPLPVAGPVTLLADEIMPVVQNFELAPGVKLDVCAARILGISRAGKTTTLVVYGASGEPFEARFTALNARIPNQSGQSVISPWKQSGSGITLQSKFENSSGDAFSFRSGDQTIRVLPLTSLMADRTWFVETGGKNYVVSGPDYLGDVALRNGVLSLQTESPWRSIQSHIFAYGEAPQVLQFYAPSPLEANPASLPLKSWQVGDGSQAAKINFDDTKWLSGVNPLQMGSDNDVSSYAWYRVRLSAPETGNYTLNYRAGNGNLIAFLDGKRLQKSAVQSGTLELNLTAGQHSVALFASHNGRDKFFNHIGSISDVDMKGIHGEASLSRTRESSRTVGGWKMRRVESGDLNQSPPAIDATWQDYKIGDDAFDGKGGRAWFAATLPDLHVTEGKIVHFGSVDENATVFLNGMKIGEHRGWNLSFDLDMDANWKKDGPNQIAVLITNQSYGGGIDQPVSVSSLISRTPVLNWKLRGGPGSTGKGFRWNPLSKATDGGGPQWYRARFAYTASKKSLPIWRLKPRGLSRGSVWLNGHNLGRYPERIAIDGLYLPESWLRDDTNTIEIFDEEGNRPDQVVIEAEVAASRDLSVVSSR